MAKPIRKIEVYRPLNPNSEGVATWKTMYRNRFPLPACLVVGSAWLWLAFALVYLTDAACVFLIPFAMVGSGLLVGVFWTVLTAVRPYLLRKPYCILWLTVPLAGLIGIGLGLTDVGFRARVALSEQALAEEVEFIRVAGVPVGQPRTVGLFCVEETQTYDDGVYLFTSQSFLNWHGIAHIPPGSRVAPRMSVRHLFGEWYRFEWRF